MWVFEVITPDASVSPLPELLPELLPEEDEPLEPLELPESELPESEEPEEALDYVRKSRSM